VIQESGSEAEITEETITAGEFKVSGQQRSSSLVALGKQTEEHLGIRLGEGDETYFVHDEQV